MLRWLLFATLMCACASLGREDHVFEGEDEADLYLLLPRIYDRLPEVYRRLLPLLEDELGSLGEDELAMLEHFLANDTRPSEDCVACRAFLGLLYEVVEAGTWEDIQEAFMDLCYIVVNASDDLGIPEYICPGISKNYLSHAVYVLNTTSLTTDEICVQWNECIFTDFNPPWSENETLVCKPPPIPAGARREPVRRRAPSQTDLDNALKVVHMTDIHVDGWYQVGAPTQCGMPTCCRDEWPGDGEAGYWGDYNCNQPLRITDLMLSHLNTLQPNYVMYTGDNPPHTPWEDTYDSQVNMSQQLATTFATHLPGIRVLPALGNHDIAPVNLYFNERQIVMDGNRDLSYIWESVAGFGPDEMSTFQYAAYYTTLLQPGLRVLTYNSNFAWLENFYTLFRDRHPDYETMKQWMEDVLAAARLAGEKVIVLAHHITGQSQGNNENSCFITDIHARYGDIIVLHLFGHKHGDLWRLVRDVETGETRGVQISSPAGGTRTNRNPSMRVFYLDQTTFDVLDSDLYRVNMSSHLQDIDGVPSPTVDFAYRFTEEYNVTDMSPASMEELTLRLRSDPDEFQRYLFNYESGNPDDNDLDCDADCLDHETCEMMNTAYPGYLVCRGKV